jgi:hypothetical protein
VRIADMIAALEARTALSPLRLVLRLDAVVTGVNGLAYLVAAGLLDGLLGPTTGFLRVIGVFLVAFAVGVWSVSAPDTPRTAAVEAVIVANAAWVVASLALVLAGWQHLTTAGAAWAVLQAAAVGAFAALQGWTLARR